MAIDFNDFHGAGNASLQSLHGGLGGDNLSDDELRALVSELVKVGRALSAEKDHGQLLEMIVTLAKRFTNADGCTLYIKDENRNTLEFAIVQNDSLNIRMGGKGEAIAWEPVPLVDADGNENHSNVSAHCALTGETIKISDVYDADFDFQGTKKFDGTTGYRSKSMLVIPMRDHENEIIGVVQLLNALDPSSKVVTDFKDTAIDIVSSLSSQAAISITNMRLITGLENLLQAIVKMVAKTIDEKSPYTAGHVSRVAEIAETFVKEINQAESGPFAKEYFNVDKQKEMRMAAWLHDVGKIVTPEYIIDKATKLETIFDRIDLIKSRIEILRKEAEIKLLKAKAAGTNYQAHAEYENEINQLDDHMAFLEKVNVGGEFLSDEDISRVKEYAGMFYDYRGQQKPLLTENEVDNLIVRKGTLTDGEREIINNHVSVSIKMLDSLPFPKKLSNVSHIAGMHHEKLDGTGYPRGLNAEKIPMASRILAVADVFEALTAADRPYKPGKLLSESIKIVGFMVRDGHLDEALCDFLIDSGMVIEYARKNLAERQLDDFEWKGKKYSL